MWSSVLCDDFRLIFVRVCFRGANSAPFVSDLQAIREPFVLGGIVA